VDYHRSLTLVKIGWLSEG